MSAFTDDLTITALEIITLTKQGSISSSAMPEWAGAPEIPSAMIDAGLAVYLDHCPDSGLGDQLDREMIAKIIRAAIGAS